MRLSAIEEEVLWACGDDFEAPHTICSGVAREMERPVSESEVRAILLSLSENGFVQPYVFDDTSKKWRAIPNEVAAQEQAAWYAVTGRGREFFDDEAI
jgi:hypothetical protein